MCRSTREPCLCLPGSAPLSPCGLAIVTLQPLSTRKQHSQIRWLRAPSLAPWSQPSLQPFHSFVPRTRQSSCDKEQRFKREVLETNGYESNKILTRLTDPRRNSPAAHLSEGVSCLGFFPAFPSQAGRDPAFIRQTIGSWALGGGIPGVSLCSPGIPALVFDLRHKQGAAGACVVSWRLCSLGYASELSP